MPSDNLAKRDFMNSFRENGIIVLTNVISNEELEKLKTSAQELAYSRSDGLDTFAPYLYMEKQSEDYFKLVRNEEIIKTSELLTAGLVDVVQDMFYFKPPGHAGLNRHQDNYYLEANPTESFITAWVAIDDADQRNGGLVGYSRSHLSGLQDIVETPQVAEAEQSIDHFNERKFECKVPRGCQRFAIDMKAGNVAFIHSLFIHESGTNTSKTRFRRAIAIDYIRQGANFRAGETAKRVRTSVY